MWPATIASRMRPSTRARTSSPGRWHGWALAGAIGGLAACLVAPTVLLEPAMMVRVLIFSLVAATLGGLDSLGGALLGGLLIGVSQTMVAGYIPFIGTELSLHLLDGHRSWASQRRVVGEILGKLPINLGKSDVNGREAISEILLNLGVAPLRRLAFGRDEALVLARPFVDQILPLAH